MRDPCRDPAQGDVLSYPIGDILRGRHRVHAVVAGVVHYWDEGLLDRVTVKKWRNWYVGKPGIEILQRGEP